MHGLPRSFPPARHILSHTMVVSTNTHYQVVLLAHDSVLGRGGKKENRLWKRVTPSVTEFAWLPPAIAKSFCGKAFIGTVKGSTSPLIDHTLGWEPKILKAPWLLRRPIALRGATEYIQPNLLGKVVLRYLVDVNDPAVKTLRALLLELLGDVERPARRVV